MIKAVRGTRDLLPPETAVWDFAEGVAREVFRAYNFGEIRTPIFEETQLFARSVGEETDIVSKEMFTWEDRGRAASEQGQSLTLRPENTAGVVRAYIEHKLWERPGIQKLFYIGPQFRRERPQKGRFRQFYQIGAEAIGPSSSGSESPARDAEVLQMLAALLNRLGVEGWTLELSSVGCPNDRPRYFEALRLALAPVAATMCVDCQRRAGTNPLRVLDCKVPSDQPIIEGLPKILDHLDDDCRDHFGKVREILDRLCIPYHVNQRLVRGLDYYQRTTFEFTHGALGAQNAILGGGRYDGLSESLGGPRAPGIGFAMGEDRLVLALMESARITPSPPDAYVAPLGPGMDLHAAQLARELRSSGLIIELGDETFRVKKSLETADRLGAHYVVIVGENEVSSEQYAVRDLKAKGQTSVPLADLTDHLRRR
ncbi:MAG: histidine--tRNA ligase [Terriglobales bacterium]|jgi:histidyl-tRNA synthetase